jgi:tRNA threonylcarbamoyladenosine biosynthesis protein TsaE
LNTRHVTHSLNETLELALKLTQSIPLHSIILLLGEVGAGKTTFVRGFTAKWGLEAQVTSPTFTLMNEYKVDGIKILHYDLYRLSTLKEVEDIGFEDFISSADYVFVEWPELALPLFDFPVVKINIRFGENEEARVLEIDNGS